VQECVDKYEQKCETRYKQQCQTTYDEVCEEQPPTYGYGAPTYSAPVCTKVKLRKLW
jgi:hypothetical protein